ncbi:MAG: hypothetical protein GY929_25625 [Actinomycetia bacterium]|nr:hypothetical protein [Actinomycetes bacterium]
MTAIIDRFGVAGDLAGGAHPALTCFETVSQLGGDLGEFGQIGVGAVVADQAVHETADGYRRILASL